MYEQILQDVFKSKNSQKAVIKQSLEAEIEKNKERLNRAQQMMLDGEMDMADYKAIKSSIEPKIDDLLNKELGANPNGNRV